MKHKELLRRVVEISYRMRLSHVGSCLSALPIIADIYEQKKTDEKFVLSNAHSSLAYYVVLEYNGYGNAEELFKKHGVHCSRDPQNDIWVSGGSLGWGIAISSGLALADRSKNIWCMVSDGETFEGTFWESLQVARQQKLDNLKIICSANGWGAYQSIDIEQLEKQIISFGFPVDIKRTSLVGYPAWLQEQRAHYEIINEEQYEELKDYLS